MNEKLSRIKEIIDFAREQGLRSFALEDETVSVSFEFAGVADVSQIPSGEAQGKSAETIPAGAHYIESPLDGKFYRSPSPDADPYVQIGSKVLENETVCIIEAMKVMNEIAAEAPGRVTKILCENGDDVRAGQKIILVEPA
jgi:acetyl-CoA carboxylase biotin carboxyl carrier protein